MGRFDRQKSPPPFLRQGKPNAAQGKQKAGLRYKGETREHRLFEAQDKPEACTTWLAVAGRVGLIEGLEQGVCADNLAVTSAGDERVLGILSRFCAGDSDAVDVESAA